MADLVAYPDGGAMMLSYNGTVVTRLDANLEEIWSWVLSDGNLWKQVVLDDGNILLVGSSNSIGVGGYDITLIKIDIDGNIIDSATLGSVEDETIYMVEAIENDELLIGGTTGIVDPTIDAAFIIRMGYDFEISSCTPFTLQSWSPQIASFAYIFGAVSAYNTFKITSVSSIVPTELGLGVTLPASCVVPW